MYDTRNDFSLVNDLSKSNPAKLKEMQALFMTEAARNHALPIDDRGRSGLTLYLQEGPDLMGGRTSLTVYQGMRGMSENVFINNKNRSFTITAEIDSAGGTANGVLLAQAGRFGGWSLFVKDGSRFTHTTSLV